MVPLPGTLGAFIRMKSLPRSRRAMFDIGAAGPWAGFIVALIATAIGLRMSQVSPLDPSQGGIDFGNSIIFWVLSRVLLGVNPNTVEISLHPLALAGWYGIFVTTLNLLPVGQLDGGHVAYALFGPRGHRLVSRLAWLGCLGLAVVPLVLGFEFWPGWFLWFLIVIALGLGHPSTGDIETPLRGPRRLAAWATVGLFIITFVPVPLSIVTPKAPVVIPPSEGPRYSVMYRVASSGAWRPHAALPYSNLIR
jgi:membrane-associated protease RseP (regulator of RpoE activity)